MVFVATCTPFENLLCWIIIIILWFNNHVLKEHILFSNLSLIIVGRKSLQENKNQIPYLTVFNIEV